VQRVEGVRTATFSYERGEGVVTYDTTRTTPQAFIAELERMTGYSATLRDEGHEGHDGHDGGVR
jgi:hypothetical protein